MNDNRQIKGDIQHVLVKRNHVLKQRKRITNEQDSIAMLMCLNECQLRMVRPCTASPCKTTVYTYIRIAYPNAVDAASKWPCRSLHAYMSTRSVRM